MVGMAVVTPLTTLPLPATARRMTAVVAVAIAIAVYAPFAVTIRTGVEAATASIAEAVATHVPTVLTITVIVTSTPPGTTDHHKTLVEVTVIEETITAAVEDAIATLTL
jgi:hypothetical protein